MRMIIIIAVGGDAVRSSPIIGEALYTCVNFQKIDTKVYKAWDFSSFDF